LGHTKCGAIKGACDHVEMGNLTTLLNKISDAVEIEKETIENRNSNNSIFVENVAANNVRLVVKKIMDDSPILKELISSGNIGIAGGIHDISTGVVTLFNDTVIVH
jgi:carbonic anhydrase